MDLARLRNLGDKYAENAIRNYLASHPNQTETAFLMNKLMKAHNVTTEELPDPLKEYFLNTQSMPDWADLSKIRQAQNIFLRFGPQILLLLGSKALPLAYTVPAGAKVLSMTGRLDSHGEKYGRLNRRLLETTQFIIDVLEPDSFNANGKAIRSAQKIRLIHASIRYFIEQKGNWDTPKDGVPINMKYELGTLLAFSALTLEGLESINIKLSENERESYMHTWNVIGYFLGIPEDVLPQSYADGLALGYEILNTEAGISPDGNKLVQALIGYYRTIPPGNIFNAFPEILLRFFLGERFSTYLGLKSEKNNLDGILIKSMKFSFGIYGTLDKNIFIRRFVEKTSLSMMKNLLNSLERN